MAGTKYKRSKGSGRQKSNRSRRNLSRLSHPLEELETDFLVLSELCRLIREVSLDDKTCESILKLVAKSVEYSSASLFRLDKTENQIEELASVGKKVDLIDFVKFNTGSGFSAWVAMQKRPILLPNLHRKRFKNGIRSFLSIPLNLGAELLGVINLSHIKPNAFGPKELQFLTSVSGPIALGLERTFCHFEMEKRRKELEQTRSDLREIQNELSKSEKRAALSQILGYLDLKVKNPLSGIAENAEFLLKSISSKSGPKSALALKSFNQKFKKRLREITTEANQISKATEKLLRMNSGLRASQEDHSRRIRLEHLSSSARQV